MKNSRVLSLIALCLVITMFGASSPGTGNVSAAVLAAATRSTTVPVTPQASDKLQEADSALFNGNFDQARQLYKAAAATAQRKCDGLFGLGVTDFRDQQLTNAEETFSRLLRECKPNFRAYLLRADLYRQQNKNPQALADYQAALKLQPGLIDSYIFERMAAIGGDEGLKYLRLASEASRAAAGELALRKRMVAIYKALDNKAGIVQEYQAILKIADDHKDLAEAELALADLELANHQAENAYQRYQRIITDYQETEPAFSALVTLVSSGQTVDLVARTRINVLNKNYTPVIARVTNYLASTPDAPRELYILLGKAYLGLNNAEQALATFQKVRDQFPTDPAAATAALEQGNTYADQNNITQALGTYYEILADYPKSPEAPEALYHAATIQLKQGNTDDAIMLFDKLGTLYPSSEQARIGLSRVGTLLLKADPARAAAFFGRVGTAEGFVRQGNLLWQLHNEQGARQAWRAAANLEPDSFFGFRAQDLLDNNAPYQAPPDIRLAPDSQADQAAAEKWLAQVFKLASVTPQLSPELARDPRLLRGTELWALGWWDEAKAEFDALHKSVRENPLALYQLARYYQKAAIYRSSMIAATRLMNLSKWPFTTVPVYLARLAYPIYYRDLLLNAARKNNLDPLYVATLIRTESNFDPSAFSSAEARGLMQIVSPTAQEIADQLKVMALKDSDMFRPTLNIQFGTFYLQSLVKGQKGNLALALVAYNAGPGYAGGLFQQFGGDLDNLYQSIDVEETRNYIDYTYSTYAMYRLLYGVETF